MASGFEDAPAFDDEAEVSPLAFAARAGDLAEVRRILAADADPNVSDAVGETPLFEAAANGNVSVASALLLAGADPEWQSSIGGVAADLADEAAMVALFKVCCGEPITQDEQDEILTAVDHSLRQPVLCFLRSLTGEEEEDARRRREEEEWLNASPPADGGTAEASRSSGSSSLRPRRSLALPEEVEMVVSHAIQDSRLTLRVSSDATFGDVKRALMQKLSSNGKPAPNIYLVRKEHDAYQAYKEKEPIGDVREVRMVGASLPTGG